MNSLADATVSALCSSPASGLCGARPDQLANLPDELPAALTNLMTIHLFSSCPMGEGQDRCATDSFGRVRGVTGLHIADASLLCTAPGVNPQGSVMAFARRNVVEFLGR